jgi:agmatinase
VESMLEVCPDLVVIQLDAHADLRQEYTGTKMSHASVMRRIVELLGPGRLWPRRSSESACFSRGLLVEGR